MRLHGILLLIGCLLSPAVHALGGPKTTLQRINGDVDKLLRKKTEALIEYLMLKTNERCMVYDVVTDELSLVRNYRSQFQRIIGQQGYPGLLERMKKKLNEPQG